MFKVGKKDGIYLNSHAKYQFFVTIVITIVNNLYCFQSLRYSYSCNEVSTGKLVKCTHHQTNKMNSFENKQISLDPEMNVSCDEEQYLTKFHLRSELNQTWYDYICCSIEYFGRSDDLTKS